MWILLVKFNTLILLTLCTSSNGADCPVGWFKCSNGKCIASIWICDGSNDCGNLDDEKDCDERVEIGNQCLTSYFKCESNNHCIPEKWHCDGDVDCTDQSDEKNCENVASCRGFRCRDGLCIPSTWHCDKLKDCIGGEDEEFCDEGKLCSDSEFICSSGSCLNQTLVCNGKNDCSDGSDEGPHCVDPCENRNCSQNCESTPSGPQCYCDDGFALNEKDNKTCKDINECREEGFCSHTCINTEGSYRCICNSGYELVNRTCRAAGPDPLLIFSTLKEVRGMRLRSKQYFPIRNAESRATAVDVDPFSEQIYWIDVSNRSTIYSANLDGSGFKTILSHGLLVPEDIAVDYLAHNLYLTDSGLKQVLACKTDGKMCHVLHKAGVEKPRSIVLDLNKGLMYWSDWGEHLAGIYRSSMDGSSRIPIVSNHNGDKPIGWPNGIALDPTTNRLYWADAKLSTIEFISLHDLKTRKAILNSTVFHPYSLTVFEDTIYWSDWNSMSLESCNKFTGHKVTIVARENHQHIMGIHVYHPVLATEKVSNPCWSHDCSHMCLRSWESGYTCACPHGYHLLGDQETCTQAVSCLEDEILCPLTDRCISRNFICDGNADCPDKRDEENCTNLSQRRDTISSYNPDGNETIFVSDGATILVHQKTGDNDYSIFNFTLPYAMISGLAYDNTMKRLFVADLKMPLIYAVNLTSLLTEELVANRLVSPEDIAFDWMANNLYWVDSVKGTVEVISVTNRKRIIVLEDLASPVSLALSSFSGNMVISTIGDEVCVAMYGMDGKNKRILNSVQGLPLSLALHPSKSILYWTDPRAGMIFHFNYTSSRSPWILKSGINGLMSVVVSDDNLYWTASDDPPQPDIPGTIHVQRISGYRNGTHWKRIAHSSGKSFSGKSECLINNGGCSYLCLTSENGRTCACSSSMTLAENGRSCYGEKCKGNDFKCAGGQCVPVEMKCDGNIDCNDGSDELNCTEQISKAVTVNKTLVEV